VKSNFVWSWDILEKRGFEVWEAYIAIYTILKQKR